MPWSKEAARALRAHRKRLGKPIRRGADKFCLFTQGEFIAIDGEGFTEGATEQFTLAGGRVYSAAPHHYALLAASTGEEIVAPDGAYLSSADCLDFIIDQAARQRILVCFGGSYDFTHWLIDLPRDDINSIIEGDQGRYGRKYADVTLGEHDYRIELQMRKCFRVWRWPRGADKYEEMKPGKWRSTCQDRAVVWDTWGFFQGTFVSALREWLPEHPDTQSIIAMKEKRSTFARDEMELIRQYNNRELATLVLMMDRVRVAVQGMGLKLTRYDGAGAIAAALFKAHDVKAHKAECPPPVFEAARYAYSGGHIEMYRIGHHAGYVFHADINSAYPYWLTLVPSLADGTWSHGEGNPPAGFTLVRVRYSFTFGMPFYPLFFREENGSILYPRLGEGWYWWPEYDVARQFKELHGADYFQVLEWWHFHPSSNHLPFGFIVELFEQRRAMIMEDRAAGRAERGETKTFKLGYNACSGKAAQQVGAKLDVDGVVQPPAYFQIEWAGYVTAGTRAQVMAAAMQRPNAIVGVATDGIYATEKLALDASTNKALGKWELAEHQGITMVMPGVYWLHDEPTPKNPKGAKAHSRGFEKKYLEDHVHILQAWKRGETLLPVDVTRLITLGSALASDAMWAMRGRFVETRRMLKINGDNSKRWEILKRQQPHKGLVATEVRQQFAGFIHDDDDLVSAPYPIEWLEPEPVGKGIWGDDAAEGNVDDDVHAAALW